MKAVKFAISVAVMLGVQLSAVTVYASHTAKVTFDNIYPGNTTSCFVCHNGSPGILTLYGNAYVSKGGINLGTAPAIVAIETLDSDVDTINNVLEIRTGTSPNNSTALVNAVVATNLMSGDILISGPNVGGVTLAPVADPYVELGLSLPAGQAILGGIKTAFSLGTLGPVTITFTAAAASGIVKAHQITGTGTSTTLTTVTSRSGNVTFTPTSTVATVVIEYTKPANTQLPPTTGCLTSNMLSIPMLLCFGLLVMAVTSRRHRKK